MFSFCKCGHERDEHDERGCFQAAEDGDGDCGCTRFTPTDEQGAQE